jgi:hypothetical protein
MDAVVRNLSVRKTLAEGYNGGISFPPKLSNGKPKRTLSADKEWKRLQCSVPAKTEGAALSCTSAGIVAEDSKPDDSEALKV